MRHSSQVQQLQGTTGLDGIGQLCHRIKVQLYFRTLNTLLVLFSLSAPYPIYLISQENVTRTIGVFAQMQYISCNSSVCRSSVLSYHGNCSVLALHYHCSNSTASNNSTADRDGLSLSLDWLQHVANIALDRLILSLKQSSVISRRRFGFLERNI